MVLLGVVDVHVHAIVDVAGLAVQLEVVVDVNVAQLLLLVGGGGLSGWITFVVVVLRRLSSVRYVARRPLKPFARRVVTTSPPSLEPILLRRLLGLFEGAA